MHSIDVYCFAVLIKPINIINSINTNINNTINIISLPIILSWIKNLANFHKLVICVNELHGARVRERGEKFATRWRYAGCESVV